MKSTKEIEKIAKKIIKGSKKKFFAELTAEEKAELKKTLIRMRSVPTYTSKDIKSMANKVVSGGEINTSLPKDVRDAVLLTAEAIKYLAGIVNKDGNGNVEIGKSVFISERLRPGYIGAEIASVHGVLLQTERGKPYGTAVAVPTDDSVCIGYSFIDERDLKYATPIVGLYIAYKRAIEGRDNGKKGFENPVVLPDGTKHNLDANTKAQLTHFEKRALAYFHPDVYSYSRGQEGKKVVYDNYDKIHQRQIAILGEEKVKKNAPKPSKKVTSKKTTTKKTKKDKAK